MGIKEDITKIYVGYYDRAPDPAGLNYWIGRANAGMTLPEIAASFAVQAESTAKYPYLANPLVASASSFVTSVYNNLFNRAPDAAGLAYWVGELAAGKAVGQMIIDIMSGAKDDANGKDLTTLNNKVAVGVDFAADLAEVSGLDYENNASAKAAAAAALAGVTDDAGTITTANAATDTFVAGGAGVGNAIALTTGVDTIVGTAGADTISASATTLTALDNIDGAGGVDTMNLVNTAAGVTVPSTATVANVEKLNISSIGANVADVQAWTGLQSVTATSTAAGADDIDTKSNVTYVMTQNSTTVAIDDNGAAGTDTLKTVVVDKNTGLATVTSDALTNLTLQNGSTGGATVVAAAGTRVLELGLDGATAGTVTDGQATGVNVKASGTATTGVTLTAVKATAVSIDAAAAVTLADVNLTAATKITVTGSKLATITATSDVTALTEIDASAATGGTTIGAALGTGVVYKGGSGVDTITLGATTKAITTGAGDDKVSLSAGVTALGAGGSIDAGEGTGDTLSFLDGDDAGTATATATFAGTISNFEAVELAGAAGAGVALNLANLDNISNVKRSADLGQVLTISNMASGGTLSATVSQSAATTVGITNAAVSTTDVLNISMSGAAGVNSGVVTANEVETVNFLTDDTATTPTNIAHTSGLLADKVATITVVGDAGLTLTNTSTTVTSFDASAVTNGAVVWTTGALAAAANIKGGAGNDTISAAAATKAVTLDGGNGTNILTGSSTAANTITGGTGNDTIVGGAGVDTIVTGDGVNSVSSGAGLDMVTVGAGVDTIVMAGNANGNTYTSVTGMASGDKIDFLAGAGANTFVTTGITLAPTAAFADFLEAATAGAADRVSWFQYSGDTYLVQDLNAAATFTNGVATGDQVIKLVGLVDLSTATIDGAVTNVLTLG